MFRTRDFILLFTSVVFLLVAITATVVTQEGRENSSSIQFIEATDTDSEAVTQSPEGIDREQRLAMMREKIASSEATISAPAPELDLDTTGEDSNGNIEEVELSTPGEVQECVTYTETQPVWSPAGIEFEEVEGARLVYRPFETEQPVTNASGTVIGTETVVEKDILLQLPVRSIRLSQDSCIPTDVVGIAQDGSLIRNNEFGLYGVFGPETLIGYALDGFPIYGSLSSANIDSCGGLMTPTGYRYHLTPERTAIVYCFAGAPVQI